MWGESPWVPGMQGNHTLSQEGMLSPCEHMWTWLFSGVPVTKGQRCSLSRMGHVYLSVDGTGGLAVIRSRERGATVSSKETWRQMPSVALDSHSPIHRDRTLDCLRTAVVGEGISRTGGLAQFCLSVV